jgi:hypothetical protein
LLRLKPDQIDDAADIERGMSDDELLRKFAACTAGVFEDERAFLDAAAALERTSDERTLHPIPRPRTRRP